MAFFFPHGFLPEGNLAAQLIASSSPVGAWLADAFQKGIGVESVQRPRISEQAVRETLRDLSPFEEPGLGTLDELECLDRIDQYFLFFRQLSYYQERGLI